MKKRRERNVHPTEEKIVDKKTERKGKKNTRKKRRRWSVAEEVELRKRERETRPSHVGKSSIPLCIFFILFYNYDPLASSLRLLPIIFMILIDFVGLLA